ncbi:MAG: glycosyltransferase [Thermoplasmataceae archaeon]
MPKSSISIILAVLNEIDSLPNTIRCIDSLSSNGSIDKVEDIIIIDDGSRDGTINYIKSIEGRTRGIPVKFIGREMKMGTVDAQLAGIRLSTSDYVCVMDSDGQHPTDALPRLFHPVGGNYDIIVGSRYVKGGSNNWKATRGTISRGATILAKLFFKGARKVKDPMSGFFIVKRSLVKDLESVQFGYKLLLYTLSTHPGASVIEIPIRMNARMEGESKVVNNGLNFMTKYLKEMINYKRKSKAALKTVPYRKN